MYTETRKKKNRGRGLYVRGEKKELWAFFFCSPTAELIGT